LNQDLKKKIEEKLLSIDMRAMSLEAVEKIARIAIEIDCKTGDKKTEKNK